MLVTKQSNGPIFAMGHSKIRRNYRTTTKWENIGKFFLYINRKYAKVQRAGGRKLNRKRTLDCGVCKKSHFKV